MTSSVCKYSYIFASTYITTSLTAMCRSTKQIKRSPVSFFSYLPDFLCNVTKIVSFNCSPKFIFKMLVGSSFPWVVIGVVC